MISAVSRVGVQFIAEPTQPRPSGKKPRGATTTELTEHRNDLYV